MMGAANPSELLERLMQADEFGVKLEIVQGTYTWEFFPSPFHQSVVREVDRSVRPVKASRSVEIRKSSHGEAGMRMRAGSVANSTPQ